MTQEHKNILLKDLCARLPYGVKVLCLRDFNHTWYNLEMIDIGDDEVYLTTNESYANRYVEIEDVKPYLFPLSRMTEEQKKEYDKIIYRSIELHHREYSDIVEIDLFDDLQEFYHKNHFDYRGLIQMDLANDATGLNIY